MAIVIPSRFNGPPASANGGYVAGRLARELDTSPAAVRLSAPPPLDRPLDVVRVGESVELRDGETVVASARAATLELEVPDPVDLEAAAAAAARTPITVEQHPFPTCFGCGPLRAAGDALRHMVGPVAGREVSACPMTTDPALPHGDDGALLPEIVWAALDCPSAVTVPVGAVAHVLGTFTVDVARPVRTGEPHVVMAWALGHEGRKRYGASAILDASGRVCARAHAVWIAVK